MIDLVITAVKDRRWEDLDCFAISIDRSGFTGMKVMFVENVTEEACDKLEALGWEICEVKQNSNVHFQTWRYYPILEFLRNTEGQFRYVFVTDACDVVWQSDPTIWLERYNDLVAAGEAWRIKDQEINDVWIKRLVSHQEHQRLREQQVLCSGTIQGTAIRVIQLLTAMIGFFGDEMQGIDQGIYNVVLRSHEFPAHTMVTSPGTGFITTLGTFLAPSDRSKWLYEPPKLDWSTGLVTMDNGTPYAIVHQYNRRYGALDPTGTWRETLERRYRS